MCKLNAVVVIGFINASYEVNENEGTLLIEVGVISVIKLEKEVTVILSYSNFSALGKLCMKSRLCSNVITVITYVFINCRRH